MTALRIGISTCPNDTYAFAGLLTGAVEAQGLELDWWLGDVQQLNERGKRGELDAFKLSFAAALELAADLWILPAGAAIGFGVGPLVLGPGRPSATPEGQLPRVLCPGADTTAHLLWRLFHPEPVAMDQVVFSEIMPALLAGTADLGVCIHEGRFTFAEAGLRCVEDLGATWEAATDAPLPLGGIALRRSRGADTGRRLTAALQASLAWANQHPDQALAVMREHAQEFDDVALWKHVELYVNAWTHDLGPEGARSLERLAALSVERGLRTAGAALEVLSI